MLICGCIMKSKNRENFKVGLTYDDVLLVPLYSEILPRDVDISSNLTKNIKLQMLIKQKKIWYHAQHETRYRPNLPNYSRYATSPM